MCSSIKKIPIQWNTLLWHTLSSHAWGLSMWALPFMRHPCRQFAAAALPLAGSCSYIGSPITWACLAATLEEKARSSAPLLSPASKITCERWRGPPGSPAAGTSSCSHRQQTLLLHSCLPLASPWAKFNNSSKFVQCHHIPNLFSHSFTVGKLCFLQ